MSAFRKRSVTLFAGIALAIAAGGCAPAHHAHMQTESPAPRQFTCQTCYDEAVRVRTGPPKHRYYKTIYKHRCTGCQPDLEVYHADGKARFKCGSCLPGGIACSDCPPPGLTPK